MGAVSFKKGQRKKEKCFTITFVKRRAKEQVQVFHRHFSLTKGKGKWTSVSRAHVHNKIWSYITRDCKNITINCKFITNSYAYSRTIQIKSIFFIAILIFYDFSTNYLICLWIFKLLNFISYQYNWAEKVLNPCQWPKHEKMGKILLCIVNHNNLWLFCAKVVTREVQRCLMSSDLKRLGLWISLSVKGRLCKWAR